MQKEDSRWVKGWMITPVVAGRLTHAISTALQDSHCQENLKFDKSLLNLYNLKLQRKI